MFKKLAKVAVPLVALAVIAALTIGLNGNCSFDGLFNVPKA